MVAIKSIVNKELGRFQFASDWGTGLYESSAGHIYLVHKNTAVRVYSLHPLAHPVGEIRQADKLELRKYNGIVTLSNE